MRFMFICTLHDGPLAPTITRYGPGELGDSIDGPMFVEQRKVGISHAGRATDAPLVWVVDLENMICVRDIENGGDNACATGWWETVVVP